MKTMRRAFRHSLCIVHSALCIILAVSAARAATWPAGYVALDYIESTGTQYIDTEIYPKANTRVVCDFRLTELPAASSYCGWGSGGSKESFLFGATVSQFNANISANWKGSPTGVPVDTERHVYDLASGDMRLDGILFSTTNTLGSTAASSSTMYLFASRVGWVSKIDYKSKMAIYSCQLYEGATLVRDFVPCADGNGKPGL